MLKSWAKYFLFFLSGALLVCACAGPVDLDTTPDDDKVRSCVKSSNSFRLSCWLQACLADISGPGANSTPDGVVDVHDLLKILSGYSKKHNGPSHHPADIDKNDDVDVTDLLFILKNFDKLCEKQKRGFFGR
eukprot:COSAG05_NODE_3957_length_1752_cov_2.753781_2_plen_132_part_00